MDIHIRPKDRGALVEAALGVRPCDLVIEHAQVVNVFTGEIYPGSVGISDGFIAHVQADPDCLSRAEKPLQGHQHIDAGGQYLIPGLIDAHVHIESSMMIPTRFAEAVLPHGTTTVITDPHEIANVRGAAGVEYMLEASTDLPMRQLVLVPSCVPSVPGKEQSGAVFTAIEIAELLKKDRVVGLAEVMDYPGVLNNDHRMREILELAANQEVFIQGHAPFLSGRELSAYRAAGPISDHESRNAQEARDKMRVGMMIDARESSGSRNVQDIISGVKDFRYLDYLTLCTDDREPEDLLKEGHMNHVVKMAVKGGLDPVDAVRCATLHTARAIGLSGVGAVAPGYAADLVLTADLSNIHPSRVFFAGKTVAREGKMTVPVHGHRHAFESENTVFMDEITTDLFRIRAPIQEGMTRVRIIAYRDTRSSTTDFIEEELPVRDGFLDVSQRPDLKFAAVFNRHQGIRNRGFGLVKNIGLQQGAVGNTVAHDCHNLVMVYDTPENAASVATDIIAMGGGFSCALNQKILKHLALPVGGLMADCSVEEMAALAAEMKGALRSLGMSEFENPLLRTAFLTLAVIPHAKMTDLGMIDVDTQSIVPMFI